MNWLFCQLLSRIIFAIINLKVKIYLRVSLNRLKLQMKSQESKEKFDKENFYKNIVNGTNKLKWLMGNKTILNWTFGPKALQWNDSYLHFKELSPQSLLGSKPLAILEEGQDRVWQVWTGYGRFPAIAEAGSVELASRFH